MDARPRSRRGSDYRRSARRPERCRPSRGSSMAFFVDLTVNGLLVGLMYALVAVGFVLIYKATSVINFAQGDLMMFAAYGAAVMLALGWLPLWAVIPLLFLGMLA